jgi:hypothetical protein
MAVFVDISHKTEKKHPFAIDRLHHYKQINVSLMNPLDEYDCKR